MRVDAQKREKAALMDARADTARVSGWLSDARYFCGDIARSERFGDLERSVWQLRAQIDALINEMPLDEPVATLLAQFNAVQAERKKIDEKLYPDRARELRKQAHDLMAEIEKTHTLHYDSGKQTYEVTIGPRVAL